MRYRLSAWALFSTFVLVSPSLSCGDKDHDDTGSTTTTTGGGDGGTGTDAGTTEPEPISGTINGRVTVQLYDYVTGDSVSWADYSATFPFGGIFVGAYQQTERTDPLKYVGQTTISEPSASSDGDTYSLPLELDEDGSVRVYAALDWDGDRVVGTDEPRGVWTTELDITDGTTIDDVDLTIVAPVNTGGGSCDTMEVRGDIVLTSSWVDGDVAAMVLTTAGEGPVHTAVETPTSDGAGASTAYTLTSCTDEGDRQLRGAWDSNGNGLFDPMDLWGSYITKPDVDGNPITIGSGTLSGYDIQIPFGDGEGLGIVPFVTASGTMTWAGGSFDDLPAGTILHAMALKFRPEGDTVVADTDVYDSTTWNPADYAGQSSLDWEILVPANSVVFLWFYADTDADGIVNEPYEPVGSVGDDTDGRFPTGTTSTDGYTVELSSVK